MAEFNQHLANEDSVGVNDMSSYDREKRLISQERNEITFLSYPYDEDGLRRSKTDPNLDPSVTTYVWDGSDYLGEVKG